MRERVAERFFLLMDLSHFLLVRRPHSPRESPSEQVAMTVFAPYNSTGLLHTTYLSGRRKIFLPKVPFPFLFL
jgi:hypothetical protein